MTQRGSLPALMEEVPRTRIVEVEPGWPEPEVMDTPAIFPESILSTEVTGTWASCSLLKVDTEPVFASRLTVPYATTMASSRMFLSCSRSTLSSERPLIATSAV